jgi:hypothetical protein
VWLACVRIPSLQSFFIAKIPWLLLKVTTATFHDYMYLLEPGPWVVYMYMYICTCIYVPDTL